MDGSNELDVGGVEEVGVGLRGVEKGKSTSGPDDLNPVNGRLKSCESSLLMSLLLKGAPSY